MKGTELNEVMAPYCIRARKDQRAYLDLLLISNMRSTARKSRYIWPIPRNHEKLNIPLISVVGDTSHLRGLSSASAVQQSSGR